MNTLKLNLNQPKPFFMLLVSVMILSSCEMMVSQSSNSNLTSSEPSSYVQPVIAENPDYLSFFNSTTKIGVELIITASNLKQLNDDGNSDSGARETYHQAAVKFFVTDQDNSNKVYEFEQVGVRMKGNLSRQEFVNNESYIYDLVHFKFDFSEFIPNQRLLGMSRLDLKWNRNFDHSQIKQLYSYKFFQDYLPIAPNATLGSFTITQTNVPNRSENLTTYMGVYTIIETIDRRVIKRIFPESDSNGNLYKLTYTYDARSNSAWPANFRQSQTILISGNTYTRIEGGKIGIQNWDINPPYRPSYDLKTNKQNPNFSDMANLIGLLKSTTNYSNASMKAQLQAKVEIDAFIMMEAIAYFIGNPDDFRNNFNNAYVYFVPSTNRAIFIPYDFDRGFGAHGNWDPTLQNNKGPSLTNVGPFEFALLENNIDRQNPLYRFTIMQGAIADYLNTYRQYLNQISQSKWLSRSYFESMYQQYATNYAAIAVPDNQLPYAQFSLNATTHPSYPVFNMTFHQYIESKLNTFNAAVNN
jgi:spore coat protein CotH